MYRVRTGVVTAAACAVRHSLLVEGCRPFASEFDDDARRAPSANQNPGLLANPGFVLDAEAGLVLASFVYLEARSKRSAFITFVHAATKSFTNFFFAPADA